MPNTCGSCAAESDAPGAFTYSNHVGQGNHAAVARLAHFMRALRDWEGAIARFLAERLQLELKAEPGPRPVTDGADFLGYIVRPDYVLVRRRVVGNLRLKLAGFAQAYVTATSLRLPPAGRERLRAILASYLGHFAHADA